MVIPSMRCGLLTVAAVLAALTGNPGGAAAPLAATLGIQRPARTAPASGSSNSIRRPRGIYAVVVLQETRGAARVDLNALASNPAVSGLAIRAFWSELQPAKDRYDFSPLDAAFASAAAVHKTVQLILVPGFGTPAWLLSELSSCDDLLTALTETGGRAIFADLFRNVTIVLTRGSGLLDFTRHEGNVAEASIVSSFAAHGVGADSKATQTSGMKACRETVAGIKGVKELSSSSPILGGAQFNTSFSQKPAAEGCKASCNAEAPVCRSVTPAEALSNVLSVYFDGTPDGALYGASKGAARMNYLQIYEKDILFANTQPEVQTILEQASRRLLMQTR